MKITKTHHIRKKGIGKGKPRKNPAKKGRVILRSTFNNGVSYTLRAHKKYVYLYLSPHIWIIGKTRLKKTLNLRLWAQKVYDKWLIKANKGHKEMAEFINKESNKITDNKAVDYITGDDKAYRLTTPESIKELLDSELEAEIYFKDGTMKLATELKGQTIFIAGKPYKVP
jgi:hypothetical protein